MKTAILLLTFLCANASAQFELVTYGPYGGFVYYATPQFRDFYSQVELSEQPDFTVIVFRYPPSPCSQEDGTYWTNARTTAGFPALFARAVWFPCAAPDPLAFLEDPLGLR